MSDDGVNYTPTSWWRVIDPGGAIWCETSDEDEARKAVRPGDKLQHLHTYVKTYNKWITMETD